MSQTDQNLCPVCQWSLIDQPRSAGDAIRFNCPRCDIFIFSRSALEDLPSVLRTDRQRAALSYSIRRAQKVGGAPRYQHTEIHRILKLEFLPSPHEQADNLIRWLGDTAEGPGVTVAVNARDHGAIVGSLVSFDSFAYIIKGLLNSSLLDGSLLDFRYIKPDGGTTGHAEGQARVTLSFAGWKRYEELKRGLASGNVAFMAMQYQDPELDQIVDDYFRPALSLTGFTLRRLDDRPQAGLIDDRLRVEIKGCRFLIADLSHGNRGVHWEAGYAEGLGKPVIYTCHKDVFSDPNHTHHPHFDTNHHLTVSWDLANIKGACQRLKETIRATIPDAIQQD